MGLSAPDDIKPHEVVMGSLFMAGVVIGGLWLLTIIRIE
jgi:hypothetical protein